MKYANLCTMHRGQCEIYGPRTALRYKCDGLYREITWSDYRWMADRAAAGLIELGVRHGDRVAILSENRYEWMVADQAILSTGAADVPLHAPLASRQVEYQVGHSESRGVIVSNQEQANKVFEVLASLPNLEFIVAFGAVTPSKSAKIRVLSWDGLMQRGSLGHLEKEIRQREAALTGKDLATIIYTSGTTGNPKGVMLTHGNLVQNAETSVEIGPQPPTDLLLSWLPYSHIYARTCDLYVPVLAGTTVALAESMDTLILNLAETRPSTLTSVPRFYEKVWAKVEQLSAEARAGALKKIFGPRVRQLSSGGAPLPRHVCEGFFQAGIPLLEGYGLTETSPVVSFNTVDNYKIGTVGPAIPGVEIKIAEDGEILVRGPNVMQGYWRNPEATAEAIDKDKWFHTGDVGHLDADGYLTITDRKKDLIITSAGKNIAPSELERILVSDIYIDQAVCYGDGRRFVSALIVPNFEQLKQKAAELKCKIESNADGFIDGACHDFLAQRIDAVMQNVSNPERVKKFLVLDRSFQLDADELTATLKVRRNHIIRKFERQLAALYDE
jgi:long-chain acyl-CoA synthetase